ATRASDAAWVAAHRAGATDLRRTGVAALATAVLPWAAVVVPDGYREAVIAVTVLVGVAAILVFTVRSAVVGVRAARAVTDAG
ncbi:hypothetical protein, partial [Shewanella algae]|uniref:hypothetical protein n=1 Tax=Shewanella algae TaxID=38313 RepID=UPI00313C6B94